MNDLFGLKHIIVLAVSIIGIVLATIFSRKTSMKKLSLVILVIGIITEAMKMFSYILMNEDTLGGYLPRSDLPLHLCSVQIIFLLIINLSHNQKLNRTIISFMIPTCLIGGIAAILLPTSSARNVWVITIQYFLYHSAITVFALHSLLSKELKLNVKDYLSALVMLVIVLFFSIYVNSILYNQDDVTKVNFLYIINPPMDGLPFLNKDHGWLVYFLRYVFLMVSAITLVYIVPIINYFKTIFKKSEVDRVA
ncbi:MAG: YwaF family protein [Gammaproteobacteria bacterium]|nr:YwaF family protein [Gammaproteobacteria bacterium]